MKRRGRDERTLKMMANFMSHHEAGMSIPEIAKKYDLTARVVYYRLDEIAEAAGVTRESLLEVIQPPRIGSNWYIKPVEKVDTAEFDEHLVAVRADLGKLQQSVRNSIKICDDFEAQIGG